MQAFSQRRRLDTLFAATAIGMFALGAFGFLEPTSWAKMFDDGGAVAQRHIQGRLHLKEMIRLFSAFLIGQSYLVWIGRRVTDGAVRRGMTRGLLCSTFLMMIALGQAHQRKNTLSRGAHGIAFVSFFGLLSMGYAWFAFLQPPAVFRGIGHESSD